MGEHFMRLFVALGGLRPEDDVLDVGCGAGRMAVPLTSFLTGSYEGFDIVSAGVHWCQKRITTRFPTFRFQVVNVHNRRYNPRGRHRACDYRFPYDDRSFTFVIATSVFTHLLPEDTEHYLSEIRRVLRPGGRCVATFFLLNAESQARIRRGDSQLPFMVQRPGYATIPTFRHIDEAAVAFPEQALVDQFAQWGFLTEMHYGSWSGRNDGETFQDLVIARVES
jgi:ubiquinone/menaquinone biosynthesis C-methylase UbiE